MRSQSSPTVRAHRSQRGQGKKAQREPGDHALGRSLGCFGYKITSSATPMAYRWLRCTGARATYFELVMQCVAVPARTSRLRNRPKVVVADKGCDSKSIRRYCSRQRIKSFIPVKDLPEGKTRRKKGPKPKLDKEAYLSRNIIKGLIGWLKNFRGLAFRSDKLALCFAAMISVAMIRHYIVKYL
jgi:hypothetical protein